MASPNDRDLAGMIRSTFWPAFKAERARLDRLDKWYRWEHDQPHSPQQATTREYKQLVERAQTPWLQLVVTAVAQALYVEGYRRADDPDNAQPWSYWQDNGLDGRQIAVHRAALAYGLSYATVLPGTTFAGTPTPVIRGKSPRRMIAFYLDAAADDWPAYALETEVAKVDGELGYVLKVYDSESIWRFQCQGDDLSRLTYVTVDDHRAGICPVVRFANMLDLEGRADGEVEPVIPLAARIDQTTFDRLVVQRFSSWVVRTIAGMSAPDRLEGETDEDYRARTKKRLAVEDILVADDPDTKFGSLPASDLGGFVTAKDADIRDLAAVTQTPPHHLLGQIANLSAEALAAAEAGLSRKVEERKHTFGESWEQALRLGAAEMGDTDSAADSSAQVRWRDMESRSLAQTADALGKIASMLGVPVEMLWERIPGWTQQDTERAKALVSEGDVLAQLNTILNQQAEPAPNGQGAPAFG